MTETKESSIELQIQEALVGFEPMIDEMNVARDDVRGKANIIWQAVAEAIRPLRAPCISTDPFLTYTGKVQRQFRWAVGNHLRTYSDDAVYERFGLYVLEAQIQTEPERETIHLKDINHTVYGMPFDIIDHAIRDLPRFLGEVKKSAEWQMDDLKDTSKKMDDVVSGMETELQRIRGVRTGA